MATPDRPARRVWRLEIKNSSHLCRKRYSVAAAVMETAVAENGPRKHARGQFPWKPVFIMVVVFGLVDWACRPTPPASVSDTVLSSVAPDKTAAPIEPVTNDDPPAAPPPPGTAMREWGIEWARQPASDCAVIITVTQAKFIASVPALKMFGVLNPEFVTQTRLNMAPLTFSGMFMLMFAPSAVEEAFTDDPTVSTCDFAGS